MKIRRTALLILAALTVVGAGGCLADDGTSGLPTEPTAEPSTPTTTPDATPATRTVDVGPVPGNEAAAPAVSAWAEDLVTDSAAELATKCWTISPRETAAMYADKDAILAALREPGVDGQFAVVWTGPGVVVSVKRSEIASGYACPRVYPSGDRRGFTDNDAIWTVQRYLGRAVGTPVDVADVEAAYPLACDATAQIWDPYGTGEPIGAPFASAADPLDGIESFDAEGITVDPLGGDYVAVSVPARDASGNELTASFVLTIGPEGYCIGDATI